MFMRAMLFAAACLLTAGGALAGEQANAAGHFSAWLPDGWVIAQQGNRIVAHNPPDTIDVVIGPLKDADADLVDEDVADFVDDEIDDMHVASDTTAKLAGFAARRLEGTGSDEGDAIVFRALALDPGGAAAIIEALVYGDPDVMARPQLQQVVDHILHSLRPAP